MKKNLNLEKYRISKPLCEGHLGFFVIKNKGNYYRFSISTNHGWDHVSISIIDKKRTPTWEEMCFFKDLIFDDDETVIQFHPSKSEYVNIHPYCLHLWKSTNILQPIPNKLLVL